MNTSVQLHVPGKGQVTLSQTDYLASGGEAAVYAKGGYVYKLYLDPAGACARGIRAKLLLLQAIRHPFIVTPIDILENAQHEVLGVTMPQALGEPLVKTFTNAWRDPNHFGMKESLALVENMRQSVLAAHQAGAVLVDANEMNWLAQGTEPRLLDVDSWQIGPFKASAIMPSIRDWHSTGFSVQTDWFSWAVVSFQVLAGIHPYKGTHPDFKRADLAGRMRANASVFDSRVSVNAGVRDYHSLPRPLLDWYREVFQAGWRGPPPSVQATSAPLAVRPSVRTGSTQTVTHDLQVTLAGDIVAVLDIGVALFRGTDKGDPSNPQSSLQAHDLLRNQGLPALSAAQLQALLGGSAALIRCAGALLYASLQPEGIVGCLLADPRDPEALTRWTRALPCTAQQLLAFGNRLFALNQYSERGLTEIRLDLLGPQAVLSVGASWPFLAQASRRFRTLAIFDALGTPFLVLPGPDRVSVERAAGLAAYRLVDAFMASENQVLALAYQRTEGQLYRLTLLRQGRQGFVITACTPTDTLQLNAAVNAQGICVEVCDGGTLAVSSVKTQASQQLHNTGLDEQHHLFALPSGLHYWRGPDLVRITTRTPAAA